MRSTLNWVVVPSIFTLPEAFLSSSESIIIFPDLSVHHVPMASPVCHVGHRMIAPSPRDPSSFGVRLTLYVPIVTFP